MPDATQKPNKPSDDFPLFPHACGKWAKKIKGRLVYFGKWADPNGALTEYEDSLKLPTEVVSVLSDSKSPECLTMREAMNLFLEAKEDDLNAQTIAEVTFNDYTRTATRICQFFGPDRPIKYISDELEVSPILPSDFTELRRSIMKTRNIISTGNEITRIKTVFGWLKTSHYLEQDLDYGPEFKKPSAKSIRRLRRESGKKLFTQDEILTFLDYSGVHMRAMILLAINCGYGNNDCGKLPLEAGERAIQTGWLEFHRPKTEIDRSAWLWDVTRETLKQSLERRKDSALPYFFVKANSQPYTHKNCDVAKAFRAVRLSSDVQRGGFYWLRHNFETVGGSTADQVAVDYIMGHVDGSTAANYREEIWLSRLKAVSAFVEDWLFRSSLAR